MNQEHIDSPAYQSDELHSERLRIFGVLGFMTIVVIVTVVRVFVIHTAAATSWARTFFLVAVVMAYELWMLRKVGLALKSNTCLGPQFWILSTILETSIPAFAIAFLTSASLRPCIAPWQSRSARFFIFIILSTLRLSPWIAGLSGIVATVSYICSALSSAGDRLFRVHQLRSLKPVSAFMRNASFWWTGCWRGCGADPQA